MTPVEAVARRLALVWGVHAVVSPPVETMTEAVGQALRLARRDGFIAFDQSIVVVAGVPFGEAGATNALRVAKLERAGLNGGEDIDPSLTSPLRP